MACFKPSSQTSRPGFTCGFRARFCKWTIPTTRIILCMDDARHLLCPACFAASYSTQIFHRAKWVSPTGGVFTSSTLMIVACRTCGYDWLRTPPPPPTRLCLGVACVPPLERRGSGSGHRSSRGRPMRRWSRRSSSSSNSFWRRRKMSGATCTFWHCKLSTSWFQRWYATLRHITLRLGIQYLLPPVITASFPALWLWNH